VRPGAVGDPVVRMRYEHTNGPFDLVLGPQTNLFTSQPAPSAGPLLNWLLEAPRTQELSRKIYGLRVFTAHRDGRLHTNEALLDREPWPAAEAVVADSGAPLPEGLVGMRFLGLLVPTPAIPATS
jgi:hypothetical protein